MASLDDERIIGLDCRGTTVKSSYEILSRSPMLRTLCDAALKEERQAKKKADVKEKNRPKVVVAATIFLDKDPEMMTKFINYLDVKSIDVFRCYAASVPSLSTKLPEWLLVHYFDYFIVNRPSGDALCSSAFGLPLEVKERDVIYLHNVCWTILEVRASGWVKMKRYPCGPILIPATELQAELMNSAIKMIREK
mmetsp:Transcript_34741/g.67582  ORF Transcript_34741/g.67582 Transcript_34741/m.67582 type:complete len:194 (+) Transcript_34741:123-704(+)